MTSSSRPPQHQPAPGGATSALANSTETVVLENLVRSLNDRDWRVRQAAAESLGKRGGKQAVAVVLQAMRDEHHNLRVLNGAVRALSHNGVDVVAPLTEFLKDCDPQLRIAAALTLGERKDPRAVPALLRALEDVDANVRFHAIEALGKLRAGDAVDALVSIARSGDFGLAAPALDALAAIGDCSIAPQLTALLDDELLQSAAIEALGHLGDEETTRSLAGLINTSAAPPADVARGLVRIWQRYEQSYRRGDLIAGQLAAALSPAGVDALLTSAGRANDANLPALATLMGWLDDSRAESLLVGFLDAPAVRSTAIDALIRKGPRVADRVAARLLADDPDTKTAALQVLREIGDRNHTAEILSIADSDPDLAVAAIDALAVIGDSKSRTALVNFLRSPEAPVRQAAVSALASTSTTEMAVVLPQLLADANPLIRESAVRLASGSASPRWTELLLLSCRDEDEGVRCAAYETLGATGDAGALPVLSDALQTAGAGSRVAAVQALGRMDFPAVGPLLQSALDDADPWVRYFAARLIGSRQIAGSTDLLTRIAERDTALYVRVAAIDALAQIKAASALPLLIRLTDAADGDLKHAALASLGAFDQPEIPAPLLAAVRDAELGTKLAAIGALGAQQNGQSLNILSKVATEDDDPAAMKAAIDALGHSPVPEACDALLALAAWPACRDLCVAALARMPVDRLEQIARGLRHADLDVRRATVEALSGHPDRRAWESLRAAADDSKESVRRAAMKSLAVLAAPRSRQAEC